MGTIRQTKAALLSVAGLYAFAGPHEVAAQSAQQPASPSGLAEADAGPSSVAGHGDIVVTATKQSERLQDVPVPVSVVDPDVLTTRNQTRLADYFSTVPGLALQPGNQSAQSIVIRGISTGIGNPSVGITVDDVPFGSSSVDSAGFQVPDFDPGDLKQIEVLRGPQGTLYGASSLSGLIKFETVDPSTSEASGRLLGGVSVVNGTGDIGYTGRGAINLPVSENVAVRASGFYRRDAGWLDNSPYGDEAINSARALGGRFSVLFRPAPLWRVRLSALYQRIKGGSTDDEHLDLGSQKQGFIPGATKYDRRVQAYSANIDGKVGPVELVSVTGYNVNEINDGFDLSTAFGGLVAPTFGVDGAVVKNRSRATKFSQELRGNVGIGDRLDLQLGGFYTTERGGVTQPILATDETTGRIVGEAALLVPRATYREYAAFGSLTIKFTDRFDLQFGGRESWIRQTYSRIDTGPLVPFLDGAPSPFVVPKASSSAQVFTYAVTPRLRINDHLMVYARAASGYRAGGPNAAFGVPPEYKPDQTYNYEVGAKGDLLDGKVSFDASVYYIDWKDIQLSLLTASSLGYRGNGGRAKSQGIELSVDIRPVSGLTLGGWISISDAKLTEDAPASATIVAAKGARLPFSAPLTWNLHGEYEVPVSSRVVANFGGQLSYVDSRRGTFTGGAPRDRFPDYTTLQLTAGIKIDDVLSISAYANNVTNSRGKLTTGFPSSNSFLGTTLATSIYRIRPREVGLTVSRTF